jgi:hypothetical protein
MVDLGNFAVNAGTLILLIFGLVEFTKQLGAQGNGLRVLIMVIGLVLALIFKLREIYPELQVWIDLFMFSAAGGLAACGLYGEILEHLCHNGRDGRAELENPGNWATSTGKRAGPFGFNNSPYAAMLLNHQSGKSFTVNISPTNIATASIPPNPAPHNLNKVFEDHMTKKKKNSEKTAVSPQAHK